MLKYASHFRKQLSVAFVTRARIWAIHPLIATLIYATAAVWLFFGMWCKVLGMVPRHRLIASAVIGDAAAGPFTILIGLAESFLALWILSGVYPRACAAVQSLAIASMNSLELSFARGLLLAPVLMVCANTLLLLIVWYCALKVSSTQSAT
jgi:DoxX-like family